MTDSDRHFTLDDPIPPLDHVDEYPIYLEDPGGNVEEMPEERHAKAIVLAGDYDSVTFGELGDITAAIALAEMDELPKHEFVEYVTQNHNMDRERAVKIYNRRS